MSSSDAQPPLSRRQARERERAANAGAQPVAPPPTVVPESQPSTDGATRRPGSHVAPAAAPAAQASAVPPASATEIVPGSGGLTRRQMRQMREAQEQVVRPVPLQAPTPQSSDRTVQDVIGSVQRLEDQGQTGDAAQAPIIADRPAPAPGQPAASAPTASAPTAPPVAPTGFVGTAVPAPSSAGEPEPELDAAAVEQATAADGSPDHIESLGQAAATADEPRRHRSTWSPHLDDDGSSEHSDRPADAADASRAAGTQDVAGVPVSSDATAQAAGTPVVFPLSLDDSDTNEVPVARDTDRAPGASAQPSAAQSSPAQSSPARSSSTQPPQSEPKPVTTAFQRPAGHWSLQGEDHLDAEVHDEATGARRVADTNTNALVMPNSALGDVTGALNATGEVIITGSIDLPKSLSSTGSHRPIDGAEVDRLLEQQDEQPETDASPVRASRAVSSHTSTRQVVLAAAKPKESKTPVVLAVTASGLCVAAIAVVVVALVSTHVFG